MGPFKLTIHGEYKFVSKINGQFHKLTAVYLLFSKRQALAFIQLFVTTVISLGKRIIRQRADKGGEYVRDAFKAYCIRMGITQGLTGTNTPQLNPNPSGGRCAK